MSQRPISRSADLTRLRDEGFDIVVQGAHLLVRDVPYATAQRTVARGTLISTLALSGDATITPDTHIIYFLGEEPSDAEGQPLERIINSRDRVELAPDLSASHTFSSKPTEGYPDYYAKVTAYAAMLEGPAQALDTTATARTFPAIASDPDDESVFQYIDSATSRAGIGAVNQRLAAGPIAIVGLGGTGGYILDLVAKTPAPEIHLFDGDVFSQHNAFRAPGAATLEELAEHLLKVEYFARRYGAMRRGIVAHPEFIHEGNVDQLTSMHFVFLAIDSGDAKQAAVAALEAAGVPFVDVGVGVDERPEGTLGGQVRTTLSTPGCRDEARAHIPFSDGDANNAYSRNIQIADLNALNAALAVLRWKRFAGFYQDLEAEYTSIYAIDGNHLANEPGR
ncbi:MAG TPA: ThiF family adenylyltransferase [Nocardioides sp.]